jgi:citrate lyase subunit beta/citryl-CoA lyase
MPSLPPDLLQGRSFLFVPADRPERFGKAVGSGADAIILDLEDAVAPNAKTLARNAAYAWLTAGRQAILRVNAPGTPWAAEDETLADLPGVVAVMRPKAEADDALVRLASRKPVIALIETAQGVADAAKVASIPGVARLALGAVDLCLDLGIAETTEILLPVRLGLTMASKCASLPPPVDGVTLDLRDAAVILAATLHARALGFGGKLCIHPAQIAPVHQGFAPNAADIDWAEQVLAAAETSGGAAVSFNGKMVDRPVIERAKQILARVRFSNERV